MHPVLFEFPLEILGFQPRIHSYGALIAIGFLLALWVGSRLASQARQAPDRVVDLAFWVFVAGWVGARLAYILVNRDLYLSDPFEVLRVWRGGFVFYGGLIGAFLVAAWALRRGGLAFWPTADALLPAVALGHAFGRMGCFLAGCCYGKPSGGALAIMFSDPLSLAPLHEALHPVQLYESAGDLAIFTALVLLFARRRFDGQVALSYLVVYPLLRVLTEGFRGDVERGFLFRLDLVGDAAPDLLSVGQGLSLAIGISAAIGLWVLARRAERGRRAAIAGW